MLFVDFLNVLEHFQKKLGDNFQKIAKHFHFFQEISKISQMFQFVGEISRNFKIFKIFQHFLKFSKTNPEKNQKHINQYFISKFV